MNTTPGWYGKLPSTGDFASRRLSHELIEPWDTWLAEEIATLKAQSESWLHAYLDSPTWRFVLPARWLTPGQEGVLAGILMPSVDSVGRYFPLSIMASLKSMPHTFTALEALLAWLHALDDLAADALQEDWSIDVLEEALTRLPAPNADAYDETDGALRITQLNQGDVQMVALPVAETRHGMMGNMGQALLQWQFLQGTDAAPLAWWWCEPHALVQQRQVLVSRGLPRGADFATLLGSNHDRHMASPDVMRPEVQVTATPAPQPATSSVMADLGISADAGPFDDPLAAAFGQVATPAAKATVEEDATLPPKARETHVAREERDASEVKAADSVSDATIPVVTSNDSADISDATLPPAQGATAAEQAVKPDPDPDTTIPNAGEVAT